MRWDEDVARGPDFLLIAHPQFLSKRVICLLTIVLIKICLLKSSLVKITRI